MGAVSHEQLARLEFSRLEFANLGVGLRQPHYAELLERRPDLGFVEVHSENFFADGGAALAVLHEARPIEDLDGQKEDADRRAHAERAGGVRAGAAHRRAELGRDGDVAGELDVGVESGH